jgi:quercetin dioxygenase-like cupin family protein
MKLTRVLAVSFAALALSLMAGPLFAQTSHVVVPADKVQWAPAPPFLPAGAQISVLEGNPSEKGPVTLRLKFPANYNIAAHWHSMAEAVTVVSGTFNIGMGDKLDRQASQALTAGGFVLLPANMRHFAWTAVPTVVQINLQGPFDIFYVNPADNPQSTVTKR